MTAQSFIDQVDNELSNIVYGLLEDVINAGAKETDPTDKIKCFGDLYNAFTNRGFESNFKFFLEVALRQRGHSADIRKQFCFISECVVRLDNKFKNDHLSQHGKTEDIDDVLHPLLKYLFKVLAQCSDAACNYTRSRSCQLLNIILTSIQDFGVGKIDTITYKTISKIFEARKLDVSYNVRFHAVSLAKFFQDQDCGNDPVIVGLCLQLEKDPNPHVRQKIASIIAACEETSIPITKCFLFDKNAGVRNAALLHICNRKSPQSYSTQQRITILKQCFSDPSELVRRNAEERLIPSWFKTYEDKLLNFCKDLRLGNESLDNLAFISKLLKVLAKYKEFAQIVEEIDLDFESHLPKSNLTADRVFLWRCFFGFAYKEGKCRSFFPQPVVLIEFISKQFTSSSFEADESCIFNELASFAMEVLAVGEVEKCGEIFPIVLNMMRNPDVAHDVMQCIVTLYMTFAPKEQNVIHKEVMEVIEDLIKLIPFTPSEEKKEVLFKCITIASQVFVVEDITNGTKNMEDNVILRYLSSKDLTLKKNYMTAFTMYCRLDVKDAKVSWPLFANDAEIASFGLKNLLLKGIFDILNCYGHDLFSNNPEEQLNEVLDQSLSHMEGNKERNIIVQGTLKLYLSHYTWSPAVLSKLILLYFSPDQHHSAIKDIELFLRQYGKTKQEAECLCQTFLTVINLLFDANKNSPYHRVNIKIATLQLIQFAKPLEESKVFTLEESFTDLVVMLLTRKFLKTPRRLPALDLYSICNPIIPKHFEDLLNLKSCIKSIIKKIQPAVYQQKNPYRKKSIKQFAAYLKKIQIAIDTAPLVTQIRKRPGRLLELRMLHQQILQK